MAVMAGSSRAPAQPTSRREAPSLVAWAAITLLCLGASAALVYPAITKYELYDLGLGGRVGDVGQYVRMYQGVPLMEIASPFRYRVFTPFAARIVPVPPHALLRYFDMSADKLIQLRFGLVNWIGLTVAGVALVALGLALQFSLVESLMLALLFYTAFPVVNYGGTPMVDVWGHAFLVIGTVAAIRGSLAGLLFASLAGMLAKETTALLVPVVLLLSGTAREKLVRLSALVPGLLVYGVFRFVVAPGGYAFPSDPATSIENLVSRLREGPYLAWLLFDGVSAFSALWPFAAIGLWSLRARPEEPLVRLAWLVPAILLTPFLINSNVGRIGFYAFPVVIPLALVGLRRVLRLSTAIAG